MKFYYSHSGQGYCEDCCEGLHRVNDYTLAADTSKIDHDRVVCENCGVTTDGDIDRAIFSNQSQEHHDLVSRLEGCAQARKDVQTPAGKRQYIDAWLDAGRDMKWIDADARIEQSIQDREESAIAQFATLTYITHDEANAIACKLEIE